MSPLGQSLLLRAAGARVQFTIDTGQLNSGLEPIFLFNDMTFDTLASSSFIPNYCRDWMLHTAAVYMQRYI